MVLQCGMNMVDVAPETETQPKWPPWPVQTDRPICFISSAISSLSTLYAKTVTISDHHSNSHCSYQLCVPTSRKQCDNKRRQKCNDSWRTVYDTNYEKVCDDKPTQACEKHWQDDGKGGKIWANDPAGTCKTIYKTECRDEERKVPRQEKYETCNWETYPDCYQVAGPDDCKYVAKQQCYGRGNSVKGAKCNEQPKQDCTVSESDSYNVESLANYCYSPSELL